MPYSSMGANLRAVAWGNAAVPVVVMTDNGRRRLNEGRGVRDAGRRTPDAGRRTPDAWRLTHDA